MNFDGLNKMVDYIEDNLDSEIDLKKLSGITGINFFILERIFMFLTNMTILEYIKKRRLSKAFEEIRNTNNKIIDIAFKYQYNSAPSFNRAFKQLFKITPTECRKSNKVYHIIPKEYFVSDSKKYNFDYEIKKIKSIILYCFHITATTHEELLFKIKKLYNDVKQNNYYKDFNSVGMWGICYKDDNWHYYLGSTKYYDNLEKYKVKENEYAIFKLSSRNQNSIVEFENKINNQWIPSVNYNIKGNLKIELYKNDYCLIYLPIK